MPWAICWLLTSTRRFQQLRDFYASGTLPMASELQGVWSGRCYNWSAPDTAVPQALVALSVTLPQSPVNEGPLFPPEPPITTFNIASIRHPSANPAAFDNLTSTDRTGLQQIIASNDFRLNLASVVAANALVSYNKAGNMGFWVRKYQNYFVSENVVIDNEGTYKAGDIMSACYFFKKIM